MNYAANEKIDWYDNRHDLMPGQVFTHRDGSVVMLDRRVPGDGSQWYVADWFNGWSYEDSTIEPGDLSKKLSDAEISEMESALSRGARS